MVGLAEVDCNKDTRDKMRLRRKGDVEKVWLSLFLKEIREVQFVVRQGFPLDHQIWNYWKINFWAFVKMVEIVEWQETSWMFCHNVYWSCKVVAMVTVNARYLPKSPAHFVVNLSWKICEIPSMGLTYNTEHTHKLYAHRFQRRGSGCL